MGTQAAEPTTETVETPVAGVDALAAQVRAVAIARSATNLLKDKLEAFRSAFNVEHAVLIREQRDADVRQVAAETELRAMTLAHYEATGEKKPTPGVEIKIRNGLDYNHDVAFAWGKEKGMAIIPEQLDVKAFEKIATATELDFVARTSHPSPTIATDLEKALGAAA